MPTLTPVYDMVEASHSLSPSKSSGLDQPRYVPGLRKAWRTTSRIIRRNKLGFLGMLTCLVLWRPRYSRLSWRRTIHSTQTTKHCCRVQARRIC